MLAKQQFQPTGFAAPLGEKDIRLVLTAVATLRMSMLLASLLHERFLTLLEHGSKRLDGLAIGPLSALDAGQENGLRNTGTDTQPSL